MIHVEDRFGLDIIRWIAVLVPQRRLSLNGLATAFSVLGGLALCGAVMAVLMLNARRSIEAETAAAFHAARQAAAQRMTFTHDAHQMIREATRVAEEIGAMPHVAVDIVFPGRIARAAPPAVGSVLSSPEVPEWFDALLLPPLQMDQIQVPHPNLPSNVLIVSDPSARITELWNNFRLVVPMLVMAVFGVVGLIVVVNRLILRRLRRLLDALAAVRRGDMSCRAPDDCLTEFSALARGVNDLATHLQAEHRENDLLQTRLLTLSEAERAKIASDLHDEMGPRLFALNAALAEARDAVQSVNGAGRGQLDEALRATEIHAHAVRDSARDAINNLRPMLLGYGSLTELLGELIAQFSEIAPDVNIRLTGECALDSDELSELSIYRFVRESLLNAVRHGKAENIRVSLRTEHAPGPGGETRRSPGQGSGAGCVSQIVVRVSDDGCGPPSAPVRHGYGLIGIRDRARALGATYVAPCRDGAWTITELRMPFQCLFLP